MVGCSLIPRINSSQIGWHWLALAMWHCLQLGVFDGFWHPKRSRANRHGDYIIYIYILYILRILCDFCNIHPSMLIACVDGDTCKTQAQESSGVHVVSKRVRGRPTAVIAFFGGYKVDLVITCGQVIVIDSFGLLRELQPIHIGSGASVLTTKIRHWGTWRRNVGFWARELQSVVNHWWKWVDLFSYAGGYRAYDGRDSIDDPGWFSLHRRIVVAVASYPCIQTWWNWH